MAPVVQSMPFITRLVNQLKTPKNGRKGEEKWPKKDENYYFEFQFLYLLKNPDEQRDFREFLVSLGMPDLCAYVNFSARCFALQTDWLEAVDILRPIYEEIYETYIRRYANEKIDFDDFGKTKDRIEQNIRDCNFSPFIFKNAVWKCSKKLSGPLKIFLFNKK